MKILWLCNIMLPQVAEALNLPTTPFGGWLTGLSEDLLCRGDIELSVCFPANSQNVLLEGSTSGLIYYGFPHAGDTMPYFESILQKSNPDIIHIFGTEYKHTLDMVRACKKLGRVHKTVINIQGLVHYYFYHYYAGLPPWVVHSFTLRDFIKRSNIYLSARDFKKRGKCELEALRATAHIIGRTDWDQACAEQINPTAKYHVCNETLRGEFYRHEWNIDNCEKFSIFLSQGNYPIKGFHFMLEAMPEILKRFPKAHIYITGKSPLKHNFKERLKQTYYARYIGNLIKKYGLESNITFLGSLNEKQMCERYLKSHVFVSASSIENSPNSVGEAMLLGVPTVSSDVGGVKNMLTHNEEGFIYPYDEPYMITHYVCRIFENDSLAVKLSENAQNHARITHDRIANLENMLKIYEEIGGKNKN